MTKATKARAKGPLFIALIKYWGNKDNNLRIPYNDNIAINLDIFGTQTEVIFSPEISEDTLIINGKKQIGKSYQRVIKVVDILRQKAGLDLKVKIDSNNFIPTASGVGSSASSFSALVAACNQALGLNLNNQEMSLIARQGSGSAARSFFDGFVLLHGGCSSKQAYGESLFPASYWPLAIFIVIVSNAPKKVLTTQGHLSAQTSPLYPERQWGLKHRIKETIKAIKNRDIWRLGRLVEAEALSLHSVTMSQKPAIYYWSSKTFRMISDIVKLRQETKKPIFWTIDAGENLFVLTDSQNEAFVADFLDKHSLVKKFYLGHPGRGVEVD